MTAATTGVFGVVGGATGLLATLGSASSVGAATTTGIAAALGTTTTVARTVTTVGAGGGLGGVGRGRAHREPVAVKGSNRFPERQRVRRTRVSGLRVEATQAPRLARGAGRRCHLRLAGIRAEHSRSGCGGNDAVGTARAEVVVCVEQSRYRHQRLQ